jgi:hypothetical protein
MRYFLDVLLVWVKPGAFLVADAETKDAWNVGLAIGGYYNFWEALGCEGYILLLVGKWREKSSQSTPRRRLGIFFLGCRFLRSEDSRL